MLAKKQGYFADGDAVKQPTAAATVSRNAYTRIIDDPDEQFAVKHDHETTADGANLRDVWTIAAEPLREKHYAAFPSRLVENCLRAGTSARGYCPACGAPWCRVVETEKEPRPWICKDSPDRNDNGNPQSLRVSSKTLGWKPSCACPEQEPRPGVVLDCFMGSGRTGIVARQLGLDFVGVELNEEYVTMAKRLLTESSPLFNQIEA